MAKDRSASSEDTNNRGGRRAEKVALALSVIWIAATIGALVVFGGAGLSSFAIVMLSTAIVLPLAVIWLFAFAVRLTATITDNDARMQSAIDALRRDVAGRGGDVPIAVETDALARRLAELADAQRKTEAALTRLVSAPDRAQTPSPLPVNRPRPAAAGSASREPRPSAKPVEAPAAQARMAPDASEAEGGPEIEIAELIRALQFPADADDADGFRALRHAMQERRAAQLVTAAQDVLTLLSQDGVYMDDLIPEPRPPETWRRFAAGERGEAVSELGAIGDETALKAASDRLQRDTVFRDAVHHFLRLFDQRFAELAGDMNDAEIAAIMETRTGRAFMLLGRTAGTFQ